jgi:hypothetical protein
MNTFEKVKAACTSVSLPAYPDFNTNGEDTFVVYNLEAESPKLHGDDTPGAMVADVQVHLYLPAETNFFSIKKSLADALFSQGLTYPYTDLNTIEGTNRHIVLSCEDDEDGFTV